MTSTLKTMVDVVTVVIFILTFFAGYFIRKFFSERHLRESEAINHLQGPIQWGYIVD